MQRWTTRGLGFWVRLVGFRLSCSDGLVSAPSGSGPVKIWRLTMRKDARRKRLDRRDRELLRFCLDAIVACICFGGGGGGGFFLTVIMNTDPRDERLHVLLCWVRRCFGTGRAGSRTGQLSFSYQLLKNHQKFEYSSL